MQVGGDHSDIIKKLISNRNEYWDTAQTLMNKYGWTEQDARIGIFPKCMNNFEPIMFSLMFEKEYLRKSEYQARFSKDHKTPPAKSEIDNICEFYLRFQLMAFADLFFSAIESSFRIFVRSIDPQACNNATANFQSVYSYLLRKTDQQQYEPLLNLWRLIRNTQHNNGIYIEPNHPTVDVTYDGKTYHFVNNTFFQDVNMDLLLQMCADARMMIQKVVESDSLSNISEFIDPTYHATNP